MNDKVLEIRQLVGVNALSKGLESFKIINEMKRNPIIDENGFMVPIEDQKQQNESIGDVNETIIIDDDSKKTKKMRKGSMMTERAERGLHLNCKVGK